MTEEETTDFRYALLGTGIGLVLAVCVLLIKLCTCKCPCTEAHVHTGVCKFRAFHHNTSVSRTSSQRRAQYTTERCSFPMVPPEL